VGDSMAGRVERLRACLPTPQEDGNINTKERGSRAEREILRIVEQLIDESGGLESGVFTVVESNVWLDGCFEADIVITRVSPDGSKSVFNIEVDGPFHLLPTNRRLSERRDKHLKEACGVEIVRISLLKANGIDYLSSEEYEGVVRDVLQNLRLVKGDEVGDPLNVDFLAF
jgi:hypothetical protein